MMRWIRSYRLAFERNGLWSSVAAVAVAAVATLVLVATATEGLTLVRSLAIVAVAAHVASIVFGAARLVGASMVPMVGAIAVESGMGSEPSWIRSLVLGCLWFVACELAWEAIDRRRGFHYAPAAVAQRVQEVATVVGATLAIGALAAAAVSLAPARSVPLQAAVLAMVVVVLIRFARRFVESSTAASRRS